MRRAQDVEEIDEENDDDEAENSGKCLVSFQISLFASGRSNVRSRA